MELGFLDKLDEEDKEFCFWILEEDYGQIYETRNDLAIRHLYGKDRKVFIEVLKKNPEIKFRLLPPGESALTYIGPDGKLPLVEFAFQKVGDEEEYATDENCIFNPKTMKQLKELCKRHDNDVVASFNKDNFMISYYTEILVFGKTAIDSDD